VKPLQASAIGHMGIGTASDMPPVFSGGRQLGAGFLRIRHCCVIVVNTAASFPRDALTWITSNGRRRAIIGCRLERLQFTRT